MTWIITFTLIPDSVAEALNDRAQAAVHKAADKVPQGYRQLLRRFNYSKRRATPPGKDIYATYVT